MSEYLKPLPHPTELTQPFWDGVRAEKLLIQKCSSCGLLRHTPKLWCPECLSDDYTWAQMSGNGEVYSYTIMHRAPATSFQTEIPYAVALVELDEGVKMISNLISCPIEDVKIGMPVKVTYERANDEITLFKFAPR